MLSPIQKDHPTSLIRLAVASWIKEEMRRFSASVHADMDREKLASAAWRFPGAEGEIRNLIKDRIVSQGLGRWHDMLLQRFEDALRELGSSTAAPHGDFTTEIVVAGRAAGKSDEEIMKEAERWGLQGWVAEALSRNEVPFTTEDFEGEVPISDLTIRDGIIVYSPQRKKGQGE